MGAWVAMGVVLVVTLAGTADYTIRTVRGLTSPNRATWFLWGFAPLVMFIAQRGSDVGRESLYTLALAVCPMLVVAASFVNRNAVWKLTRVDYWCAGLACVALGGWLTTREGLLGFGLALIADMLVGIANMTKAATHPHTEHYGVYVLSVVAALITIAAAQQHTLLSVGLPCWIAVNAWTMVMLVTRPWKRLNRRKGSVRA